LGLILDVLDLRVCWGQIWGHFGCEHFGDFFGKKLRLILGLILDVADFRDALKPCLGLTLGEIYLA
jgi:hypothetical protein